MLPAGLAEELEILAMEAMRGAAAGPHMARGLERDITALLRHRYAGVRVLAEVRDGGMHVQILLPQRGKPVQRIVFQIGAG